MLKWLLHSAACPTKGNRLLRPGAPQLCPSFPLFPTLYSSTQLSSTPVRLPLPTSIPKRPTNPRLNIFTLGAVVFGALLPSLGWRTLFLSQAPLSLLSGLGVYLSLPTFSVRGSTDKSTTVLTKLLQIDYLGALTLTTTIVLFLYGLSGIHIQIIPILLSFVSLAIFLAVEYLYTSDPIIPLTVLQSRGVLLSCLAQLGFMAARWTVLFYAPVFVLAVRGYSPAVAGSVLIPTNAGFGLGGVVVGWLHVKRAGSFWSPSLVSLGFFIVTISGLSFLSTADTSAWIYISTLFLNGFATGACLNYTMAHMLHLAAPETHFIATSLLATFRGFAGSFGTAIGGGVFGRTLRDMLTKGFERLDGTGQLGEKREVLITRLVGSPALVFGGGLSEAERAVAVGGYEAALATLYKGAALVCALVVITQAATGWAAPLSDEEEEEIEEEIAEHDGRMEA